MYIKGMEVTNMEKLIEVGAVAAMSAAVEYLDGHNLKANKDALFECVQSWMKAKLQAALHDAKEAIDANMPKIAEATFLATMRQAGIEAAKEAGFPNEPILPRTKSQWRW